MPKIDVRNLLIEQSVDYPLPFKKAVEGNARKRLGRAAGLTQFGVNICTLKPGADLIAAARKTKSILFMCSRRGGLCEDNGKTVRKAGETAVWKAGVPNSHCLIDRGKLNAIFIEIGSCAPTERAYHSDIDMMVVYDDVDSRYMRKDGTPY